MTPTDSDQKTAKSRRGARIATIVLAACLGAVWLYPAAPVSENHAVAQYPSLTPGGLASASDFGRVDDALAEHLGLKSAAVSLLGATISSLGLSSSVQVVRGPSGEPFYAGDFTLPCHDLAQAHLAEQMQSEQKALASQGKYFLYAIVPDKSTVERDKLGPAADALMACSDTSRAYLAKLGALGAKGLAPVLTTWDEFAARYAKGQRLYIYGDSHWNPDGAAAFTTLLLDRLIRDGQAPANLVAPGDVVSTGNIDHQGDMFELMGGSHIDVIPNLVARRQGVTTTKTVATTNDGVPPEHWVSTSTGAPLIPGRTLVLRDSEWTFNGAILAPYFADLTAVQFSSVPIDPQELARLGPFDRIIVQQVQRTVPSNFSALVATTGF